MTRPQMRCIVVLACAPATFALISFPSLGKTQTPESSTSEPPPPCSVGDLDVTLQFGNKETKIASQKDSVAWEVVTVNKRNISGHPCIFGEQLHGPNFDPDRAEGEEPFKVNQIPLPPVTLKPDQAARQTWRWRTNDPVEGRNCLQPKSIWGPPLVVAPSLLKPVCSNIDISPWSIVDAPHSTAESDASSPDSEPFALKLTAERKIYLDGEWFPLHLSLDPTNGHAAPQEDCPTLYLRSRSPDGGTRFDEMKPLAFKGCKTQADGREPGDWQSGFVLDSGAIYRWQGPGTHTLQVFAITGPHNDKQIKFAASNPFQVEILDPTTLLRRWGPLVKGLQADITLDKTEFNVGEEIPLHAAVENLSSEVQVFSWDAVMDPCQVAAIRIRDSRGNLVRGSAVFGGTPICMGHGFGPRPLEKGKIVPLEGHLGPFGGPEKPPGNYTVDLIWTPCVGTAIASPATGMIDPPKTCVTVTAEATFRIVEGGQLANR